MKKLLTLTAVAAIAVAAPAAAQYRTSGQTNVNASAEFDQRIERLEARLEAGIEQGVINRTEARSLRQRLRDLNRLEAQYSLNGYSQQERRDLQQRIRTLRQELRTADNGRFDRDTRYGWNDNEYNDGYYGQGGPYEPIVDECEQRAGIGGVIDRVLGRDDCGLRIGQRVSGNLYAVPSQYRYQYRDGNGVYYRSDGRQIYQIDSRTQTVTRVYPINR